MSSIRMVSQNRTWNGVLVGMVMGSGVGCSPMGRASDGAAQPASGPASAASASAPAARGEAVVKTAKATFGAGCFWGVEAKFRQIEGVVATQVGYMGGSTKDPSYKDVCTDRTGHAEVVEVEFDPARVSYDKLLEVFWSSHDPTQLHRQGPDVGTQYRSVIFTHDDEQAAAARASKERLQASGRFKQPVVTSIEKAATFYRAEEYHQQYLAKHGMASCASTIQH